MLLAKLKLMFISAINSYFVKLFLKLMFIFIIGNYEFLLLLLKLMILKREKKKGGNKIGLVLLC
jgi:hypothetical protein